MNFDQVSKLCEQLSAHISNGDVVNAGKSGLNLANLKALLKILPEKLACKNAKWCDLVNVTIQDYEHECVIKYHMNKSATIGELKKKFAQDFRIPVCDQVWIINGMIHSDDDLISATKTDGPPSFYLYITDSLSELRPPEEIAEVPPKMFDTGGAANRASVAASAQQEANMNDNDANGWTCPKCTFINEAQCKNFCAACNYRRPAPPKLQAGWACSECKLFNRPLSRLCRRCDNPRPVDYVVPNNYVPADPVEILILQRELEEQKAFEDFMKQEQEEEEKRRREGLQKWTRLNDVALVENTVEFECPICITDVEPGEGVQLRNCTHQFCKGCLKQHIAACNNGIVKCPSNEGYECEDDVTDMEIKALITPAEFEHMLRIRFNNGIAGLKNIYRCKTVDCDGVCEVEDDVNFFRCHFCKKSNCLTCKAIHEGMTCKQYQDDLMLKAKNDENAQRDKEAIEAMITSGEAIYCPGCRIIVMKKDGCDWIKCSMCRIEICWATKGPRWGPAGAGDTTGGCKCRLVANQPCTPNCRNCH